MYHQQYTALMSEYESASDARKTEISQDVQALDEQVQSMATAAYESSDQYSSMIQTENEKITATRDLTKSFNSFKIKYETEENLSKGHGPPSFLSGLNSGNSNTKGINDIGFSPKAFGLRRVPYNGFRALLHEGEQVLTASEARNYDNSRSVQVQVSGNEWNVRQESDIDAILDGIADRVELAIMGGAGP